MRVMQILLFLRVDYPCYPAREGKVVQQTYYYIQQTYKDNIEIRKTTKNTIITIMIVL